MSASERAPCVDFMIVGAPSCGAPLLTAALARHPDLVAARPPATRFFSRTPDWRRALPRYEAHFPPAAHALRFEASTCYAAGPLGGRLLWEELRAYNPDLRFVYLVRDPAERVALALSRLPERLRSPLGAALEAHPEILEATRYATRIMPYVRTFGRDRVLVLDRDDLLADQRAAAQRVCALVGVDPSRQPQGDLPPEAEAGDDEPPAGGGISRLAARVLRRPRPRTAPAALSPEDRRLLVALLDVEIDATAALLSEDLSRWRRS